MKHKYTHSTVSGTFDHFHVGHARIIDHAFILAPHVSVGIADGALLKEKKFHSAIESFEARRSRVKAYIEEKYSHFQFSIFKLTDTTGIALTDKTLDSIVVTRETYPNAVKINIARKAKGWQALHIVTVPFVKDISGRIIRATRIRQGEINREGKIYVSTFSFKKSMQLPRSLRALLREPLGQVVRGTEEEKDSTAANAVEILNREHPPFLITVGDVVSSLLKKKGAKIDLRIVDFRTQRGRIHFGHGGFATIKSQMRLNKPGTISTLVAKNTYSIIKKGLKKKKNEVLFIRGEEDLIALPAILLAPLGSYVVYGQLGLGIVLTKVTEEIKMKVEAILGKFQ